jgi:hypothetical protein
VNENRLAPRFICEETASLTFGENTIDVKVVDVSYGGMGISTNTDSWGPFDFAMEVKGEIKVDGAMTCFNGRICWTSTEDEATKAGLEIKDVPQDAWRRWVDQLKGIQPPEDPMFDVG